MINNKLIHSLNQISLTDDYSICVEARGGRGVEGWRGGGLQLFLVGKGEMALHLQLYYVLKLIHQWGRGHREQILPPFPRAFTWDWGANETEEFSGWHVDHRASHSFTHVAKNTTFFHQESVTLFITVIIWSQGNGLNIIHSISMLMQEKVSLRTGMKPFTHGLNSSSYFIMNPASDDQSCI